MFNISVYQNENNSAILKPLSPKRDWMDQTYDKHAYNCFPVTLTNSLGWGISFPEDISFIWDGITDTNKHHIKILSGQKYVSTERANATISFKTGLTFKTEENVSLLQIPVPNLFIEGICPYTILMSTSFWDGELPCAWRITKPNSIITIPANQPVISILPISLSELNNSNIIIKKEIDFKETNKRSPEHSEVVKKIHDQGKWANFYRNATDHNKNIIGKHEVKSIRLNVKKLTNDIIKTGEQDEI